MKQKTLAALAFALTTTVLAGCSNKPISLTANSENIDTTPIRKINRAFEHEALAQVERMGDTKNFECFSILVYPEGETACKDANIYGTGFTGSRGSYYFNTQQKALPPAFAAQFNTSEWQDLAKLFISAHEFRHYLAERNGENPGKVYAIKDPSPAAQRYHTIRRENELKCDLFALSTIRAHHPDKAREFLKKLQAARKAEAIQGNDTTHNSIADMRIPHERFPYAATTIANMAAYSDTLYNTYRAPPPAIKSIAPSV